MDHAPEEIELQGGNVNVVVKVGDTVRRDMQPHSHTIHEFLVHLEARGVPAPKFLGIDEKGREILSFIEGETTFPKTLWDNDTALVASANMLRKFHDASLGFSPSEPAQWAFRYPDVKRHEIICHNDFAPYNMVFERGQPTAILDFDLCGPGPRLRDLAYLAYWMVPLSFGSEDLAPLSERDLQENSRRLGLICQVYGLKTPQSLPDMVSEVLHDMSDAAVAKKMIGADAAGRLRSGGHFAHWAREAIAFDVKRAILVDNLTVKSSIGSSSHAGER